MTRDEILDSLFAILPSELDTIVFRLGIPPHILSGAQAPQATRVIEILRYLEARSELERVVPFLPWRAPAAAPGRPSTRAPSLPRATSPLAGGPAFDEVAEAYADKSLVRFVSAGLSTAAGLPSKRHLVDPLQRLAPTRRAAPNALDEIAGLAQRGEITDALSALEQALGVADDKALELREALAEADPTNAQLHVDLIISHIKLSQVALAAKDTAAFRKHLTAARAILDRKGKGKGKGGAQVVKIRALIEAAEKHIK